MLLCRIFLVVMEIPVGSALLAGWLLAATVGAPGGRIRGGRMRILHVTDHYPPAMGGIEVHVAGLAHRQALRGDSVTVLTSTPRTAEGETSADAGPVEVVRVRGVAGRVARRRRGLRPGACPRLGGRALHRAPGRGASRAAGCRPS